MRTTRVRSMVERGRACAPLTKTQVWDSGFFAHALFVPKTLNFMGFSGSVNGTTKNPGFLDFGFCQCKWAYFWFLSFFFFFFFLRVSSAVSHVHDDTLPHYEHFGGNTFEVENKECVRSDSDTKNGSEPPPPPPPCSATFSGLPCYSW